MTTALDVDDVLLECVPYAIKLANEKYNFDPRLQFTRLTVGASSEHARTLYLNSLLKNSLEPSP